MPNREDFNSTLQGICADRSWSFEPGCVEIQFADKRRQRVAFEFFSFEGRELVRIHSVIGSTRKIDSDRLNTALGLNFRLPHGALAIYKDDLVMVDTLMVQEAGPAEITAAIAYLAETADQYEKTMFGPDVN